MSVLNSATKRINRFSREEDGSMTIFALFMFMMMILVGGIAVDLMRNEMDRTKRQNTLDRAVLAAADLDQTLEPADVVKDYFLKSGFDDAVTSLSIDEGLNYRTVSATSNTTTPTQFMRLMGKDTLPVFTAGTATEEVPNIEISMVLDISGSMRYSDRMTELRPAARNFIDTLLEDDLADYTSINLIPYAGQTNPGPFMFDRLGGTRYASVPLDEEDGGTEDDLYPNVSSCLELGAADFTHAGLPSLGAYAQTAHFMNWTIAASVMEWGWCPQDDTAIQYASNNATALKQFITDMPMHDGTGTAYAMKYALALLDPTSQADFAAMSTAGLVPEEFSNRPAGWKDPDTAKYIVLMTDGQITEQKRPTDITHEENPTVELQHRPSGDKTQITSASQNVTRFYSICDLAKSSERNVEIYTIAFEAPAAAKTQMRNCASSPSHYYDVEGSEIDEVFQAIARQVRQLRLVN